MLLLSDLEFFTELLMSRHEYEAWQLRPIQGSNCRLEIFKDGNINNNEPSNVIRLYFCHGELNKQYK